MYTIYEEGILYYPIEYPFDCIDRATLQLQRLLDHMHRKKYEEVKIFNFEIDKEFMCAYKFKSDNGKFIKIYMVKEE